MRHQHSPVKQRRGRLEENSAGRVLSAAVSSLCVQMFQISEHVPPPPLVSSLSGWKGTEEKV